MKYNAPIRAKYNPDTDDLQWIESTWLKRAWCYVFNHKYTDFHRCIRCGQIYMAPYKKIGE